MAPPVSLGQSTAPVLNTNQSTAKIQAQAQQEAQIAEAQARRTNAADAQALSRLEKPRTAKDVSRSFALKICPEDNPIKKTGQAYSAKRAERDALIAEKNNIEQRPNHRVKDQGEPILYKRHRRDLIENLNAKIEKVDGEIADIEKTDEFNQISTCWNLMRLEGPVDYDTLASELYQRDVFGDDKPEEKKVVVETKPQRDEVKQDIKTKNTEATAEVPESSPKISLSVEEAGAQYDKLMLDRAPLQEKRDAARSDLAKLKMIPEKSLSLLQRRGHRDQIAECDAEYNKLDKNIRDIDQKRMDLLKDNPALAEKLNHGSSLHGLKGTDLTYANVIKSEATLEEKMVEGDEESLAHLTKLNAGIEKDTKIALAAARAARRAKEDSKAAQTEGVKNPAVEESKPISEEVAVAKPKIKTQGWKGNLKGQIPDQRFASKFFVQNEFWKAVASYDSVKNSVKKNKEALADFSKDGYAYIVIKEDGYNKMSRSKKEIEGAIKWAEEITPKVKARYDAAMEKTYTVRDLPKIKEKGVVLMLLTAPSWCKPCEKIEPKVDKFAKDHPNLKFAKIDGSMISGYGGDSFSIFTDFVKVKGSGGAKDEKVISGVPTFVLYKDGAPVALYDPATDEFAEERFTQFLDKHNIEVQSQN